MSLSNEKANLFESFDNVSREEWQSQILRDLKAATAAEKNALYAQKMIWQSNEGIAIRPFYTIEDVPPDSIHFPEKKQLAWQNRENIVYTTEKETHSAALEAIHSGADAISFDLSLTQIKRVNFAKLLQHIKLSETPVSFSIQSLTKDFIPDLKNLLPYHWKGSLQFDPITQYVSQGKAVTAADYTVLAEAITQTAQFPEFCALTITSHPVHEAGASAIQEIALLLASFVEYTDQLTSRGINIDTIFNTVEFSIAVSTDYFIEIAKCRALRLLLVQLAEAYHISGYTAHIHAQTAMWNKSAADAHNNMIRSTIEAMAAITGGCDALTVLPYHTDFAATNSFARRIARNISTILKEESYFDKVLNIASGAYYIESLTYTFAEEAWKLFQTIENKGGMIAATTSGFIYDTVEKMRMQKEADLRSGKQVLIGVNKYQVQDEAVETTAYFKKLYQHRY